MYLAARSGAELEPVGSETWFVIVHRGDIRMGRCCPVRRPIVIVCEGDKGESRVYRKEKEKSEVGKRREFWRPKRKRRRKCEYKNKKGARAK